MTTATTVTQTYETVLGAIAEAREEVIVMTAENRAAIRGLPPRLGKRFLDVGICEQTMIGAAAGLALRGRIPVAHALATFLTLRAFEFIRTDVGIGNLPVKLVGYVPGFLSDGNGPTHQAIEDVSLMRGIPHVQVVCPSDAEEMMAALPVVIDSGSPCYMRYTNNPSAVRHQTPFEIGKAEVLSTASGPRTVALLTYGFLLGEVDKAREILSARGIGVRLVNLRSLKPLDEAAVLEAARENDLVVTIEDHFRTGGLYSIIAELLLRKRVSAHVHPIALEERWFQPALLPDVLRHEGFTGPQLAERVLAVL
jgi:transketolase